MWRSSNSLHPGVEALGYVKMTTPALLEATRASRVVASPSLVWISPPNSLREIVSPAFGTGTLDEDSLALAFGSAFDFGLAVFAAFARTGCASAGGALRFLNSTTIFKDRQTVRILARRDSSFNKRGRATVVVDSRQRRSDNGKYGIAAEVATRPSRSGGGGQQPWGNYY